MATLSISNDDILTVLRSFLLGVLPTGVEVIAGQANRVAEPQGSDFVVMTPLLRTRLSTNEDDFVPADNAMRMQQSTQVTIQLDVHGPAGADNAQLISTAFCDQAAFDQITTQGFDVAPLYCGDPRQLPFINAEQQYEDRYVIDMQLQANPVVQVAVQFADVLGPVGLVDVDVDYRA